MTLHKSKSLKAILIWSFVLLVTIPMLVISVLTLKVLNQNLKKEVTQKNLLLSKSIASQIDEFLRQPKNMIHRIALLAENKNLIEEKKLMSYLAFYLDTYPYFEMIQVLSADGKVKYLAPFDQNYINIDMSQQTFFKLSSEKYLSTVWSPVFISQQKGQPTVTISEGTESGLIVVGFLNLNFLNQLINKFYLGEESAIGILDNNGNFIAHSDLKHVMERENINHFQTIKLGLLGNEISLSEEYENKNTLLSTSLIYSTGWISVVFQSEDEAFETIQITRLILFLGLITATVSGIGTASWSFRRILGSLASFGRESRKIAAGEYTLDFDKNNLKDFDSLANDFKTMCREIESRENKLKENQSHLESLLKEKDILLKEIHHRVKNNLQVISSLLSLQSYYVKDENAVKALKEAQSRVQSISLVHQKIYQNNNLAELNFALYLEDLIKHLSYSFYDTRKKIEIITRLEEAYLDLDMTIYCSLIINEIITNAYKYAFAGKENGIIKIEFYSEAENQYVLIIKDNGIGLPQNLDFKNPKTLGLDLVLGLVESLNGHMEVQNDGGASFKICFKKKK